MEMGNVSKQQLPNQSRKQVKAINGSSTQQENPASGGQFQLALKTKMCTSSENGSLTQ